MAKTDRNPGLKYTQLGNTSMEVSNISLGGAGFGNLYAPMDQAEVNKVVKLAIDSGINFIDTAPWYGQGKSEERLGHALKNISRDKYFIATKVGRYEQQTEAMFDFSTEKITQSFNQSLQLLGVDYVDLIQIHDVEYCASMDQLVRHTLPKLLQFKQEGKAKYVGITGYNLQVLKDVVDSAPPGSIDMVLTYCRMNVANQDLNTFIDFFKSKGIGVVNASAVAMGLLAGPAVPDWHPAPRLMKSAAMKAWNLCHSQGKNFADMSIKWLFGQDHIATTLMSIVTQDQLEANLAAAKQMSVASTAAELEKDVDFAKAKAFFDDLVCTNWDCIDVASYWEKMYSGGFKQNLN